MKKGKLKNLRTFTRRQFLRRSVAAGATALCFPYVGRVLGANEQINVACIGVGGKGAGDSNDVEACGGKIVAICDVDQTTLNRKAKGLGDKCPDLKTFTDYRKL